MDMPRGSPGVAVKHSNTSVVAGAAAGGAVLLLSLLALVVWMRHWCRRLPQGSVEMFLPSAADTVREERKAVRGARPQPRALLAVGEKTQRMDALARDDDARGQATPHASLQCAPPLSESSIADEDQQEGPSRAQPLAKEDVERMFAALKGEIYQLRADMLVEREERGPNLERPPSYN
jgi:hypothetical protein